MQKTIEKLVGDTEGVSYEFPVFRFEGTTGQAPSAYLQAALHAGELPGVVAIHALMPKLIKAEAEGRIRGDIAIVPAANPVGRAQFHFGGLEGRFHLGTRTNFNRDFPLLDSPDASALYPDGGTIDQRLKRRLIALSMGHDIVLDLHCDDEGVAYLYVPAALWPGMENCAAAMGVEAVILWEGSSGASFDEASIHPYLQMPPETAGLDRRVVTTVEYRGLRDVGSDYAEFRRRRPLPVAGRPWRGRGRCDRCSRRIRRPGRLDRKRRDDRRAAPRRDSVRCRPRRPRGEGPASCHDRPFAGRGEWRDRAFSRRRPASC